MIRTIIVDDEIQSRNALKDELKGLKNHIVLVDEFDSVKSAVNGINELKPELVFLDIHLGDGSGFEVLEKVSHKNFKVVFVTAYDNYAIKAFKYNAIDYILKPISTKDIKAIVEKLPKNEQSSSPLNDILKGLQILNTKRLPIPHSDGITLYDMNEIIRFQADGNYTIVFLSNGGGKVLTTKTLKEFEDLLVDYGFERVHHGHLLNVKHVVKYVNKDGGYLILSDKSNVPISQRKKSAILKLFENLV